MTTDQVRPVPTVTPPAEQRVAVEVRGLVKRYTRQRGSQGEAALDGVSLDVREGEFLVLLGPSGCGKTTLLRSIAGLEHPDEGSIRIGPQPVFDTRQGVDVSAERRPVSMIFQSYALWPHLTAAQNIAFPLKCRRVRRAERATRVADIMERLGIAKLADRYPSQMSGGQQQRLALARALVVGQRVVLFDEPLSNVDAQIREMLRLELIRMQRTLGFTAIYVTHDQVEAMELADRLAVMRNGQIAQLGAPQDMYKAPQDMHVARFLGQSNEIGFTVENYDAASGLVSGIGPVGPVLATWSLDGAAPQVGEDFVAFGRPNDFVLSPASEPDRQTGAPESRWAGQVEAVRFLGAHTEFLAKVGDARFRCAVPDDVGRPHDVREGDDVYVTIDAKALRAMRGLEPVTAGEPAAAEVRAQ